MASWHRILEKENLQESIIYLFFAVAIVSNQLALKSGKNSAAFMTVN